MPKEEKYIDPWEKAREDWVNTSENEKQDFYRRNASAIDRWQSETDALEEEGEEEIEKE